MTKPATGPLSDLRVIEMGTLIAGPFCGQILGDFGADVIKIEDPRSGDPMRQVHASLQNLVYHDDTNLDLEKMTNEMTKNHLLHNLALTVMTDQFQLLQTAISERV